MVHLNISIVFDPSLVFQPGNKDGFVIDQILLLLAG